MAPHVAQGADTTGGCFVEGLILTVGLTHASFLLWKALGGW